MDFDSYTDRARGAFQAAQMAALAAGHQQILPLHLLKALLEDTEGFAPRLLREAGGDPELVARAVEEALAQVPRIDGAGPAQLYLSPDLARVIQAAGEAARKAGDKFVAAERLLLALVRAGG